MKERPIRFSDTEVRAILEGRKTQTRRITKVPSVFSWDNEAEGLITDGKCVLHLEEIKCPHGIVGDRLWVREAWAPAEAALPLLPKVLYRADYHTGLEKRDGDHKWKPSIHMKRSDSRITLEITGVRVERLQEISEKDAIAEGCICPNYGIDDYWKKAGDPDTPADVFMELWQSINGPESWAANPWVWVIEFKRVQS